MTGCGRLGDGGYVESGWGGVCMCTKVTTDFFTWADSGFGAQFSTKPRRRLRNFAPIIMELMNPLYLKSHLWSCGLLSNKDVKYLDENLLKERQNNYFFRNHLEISYIIRKVDQRGSKGIQQFISCLEAENEHLGHKDLADILKHNVCSVCVSTNYYTNS